jgi:RHS repeat-associated protein
LNQVAYQPFGPLKSWSWGNGTAMTRTYDTDGQLTQVASAGTSSYTFFLDGQISSRSDDFTVSLPSTAGTATFAISTSSNRLQNATGLINRAYGYDAAGNTTTDTARTFTYNDAGRMKTSTGTSGTTTYTYNGLGERVKKASSASTTYFAYDEAGHLLGEYDAAGDLIQETAWLGDIPVAVLKPNGGGGISVFYVHTDHLNTPRRITRPSDNAIVWRWDADPFGATPANDDPDGDTVTFAYNLRFPGQYFDAETGLHYNYFRDYDAVTGRYIQSDPIGLSGGLGTYTYAGGNPISRFDPSGEAAIALEVPVVLGALIVAGCALYEPCSTSAQNAVQAWLDAEGAGPWAAQAKGWIDNPEARADWEEYKARYDAPPPPDMDPCQRLRWKLEREKRLLQDRQTWDAKWLPGRHADANAQSMRAIKRLERLIEACGC